MLNHIVLMGRLDPGSRSCAVQEAGLLSPSFSLAVDRDFGSA